MEHFGKILFVTDRGEKEASALAKVLEVAANHGATVTILEVLADYSADYVYPTVEGEATPLRQALEQDSRQYLDSLLDQAAPMLTTEAQRVSVSSMVRHGIDFVEIIHEVGEGGYDLMAKAASDNASLGARLFGTLDLRLLRNCPCPVLILKPRKRMSHGRVLAAVDLNRSSPARRPLDYAVMKMAAAFINSEKASLDVLHAWHLPHEKQLRDDAHIALQRSLEQMNTDRYQAARQHIRELVADYGQLTPVTHLIHGEPEAVIPRFVRDHRIDLVVMGTVGRTGIAGFFVGNTAEKILYALNCSVLALKPEGFVSPVQ